MSSTALSASRFAIAALAFAPYVVRGLRLPHVRRNAAELALWLFGAPAAAAVAACAAAGPIWCSWRCPCCICPLDLEPA